MLVHIRQARIIDTGSDLHNKVADLLIENGVIKKITASSKKIGSAIVVDGEEVYKTKNTICVSPGWVDVFADYREPGYEHKETIDTGLNAAAAGGFTDVFLAPNTNPAISTKSSVKYVLQKATGHAVKVHPLGSATNNIEGKVLAEMMDMHAVGAIAFTDGWKPIQNSNLMLKALEYVKAFDGTVIQLPIDMALAEGGLMNEGVVSTWLGMAGIPVQAETLMVHRDIELARYTRSKLHITGISCAESVALIRKAKKEKIQVTCSVTPYHLALTDKELVGYNSLYKVAPPLRTEADRKALVKGLVDGTIDCIATHHRPHEWDAKAKEFEYAAEGMNLQEIAFPVMWNALSKNISLEILIAALTVKPRQIFSLDNATITKGNNAKITIFTADADTILKEDMVRSASRNNPFIGKQMNGRIIGLINRSKININ